MKLDKVITILFYIILFITGLLDIYFRNGIKILRILLIYATILSIRIVFKKTFLKKYLCVYVITLIFIFFSMYLANVWDFYALEHYDKVLHFVSGILIGFLGLIVYIYLSNGNLNNSMKKLTIYIFPVIFAVAVAGAWEIWEYTTDTLFGLTAQCDLEDTMWDIILGSLGSLISSGLIYYSYNVKNIKMIQNLIEQYK